MRLDKWLWVARFFKTRRLAVEAVEGGRVSVNGERAKPAKELKVCVTGRGATLRPLTKSPVSIATTGSTHVKLMIPLAPLVGPVPSPQASNANAKAPNTRRIISTSLSLSCHPDSSAPPFVDGNRSVRGAELPRILDHE